MGKEKACIFGVRHSNGSKNLGALNETCYMCTSVDLTLLSFSNVTFLVLPQSTYLIVSVLYVSASSCVVFLRDCGDDGNGDDDRDDGSDHDEDVDVGDASDVGDVG